ncbi:MAG: DUF740 domain-containing protein [Paludibacteraceae bacterium]|nr:DUF740 domain-containing protein [Paludibacteraceae bacterium]
MSLSNRKTPRAKWHDYKGGEYFVTICTKDRVHYFGEVCGGEMQLSSLGEILKQEIENTEKIRGGDVSIPLYVIMPNHVHLIVIVCRDAPREYVDATRASVDAPRASVDAPRASVDAPRASVDAPRASDNAPCTSDISCTSGALNASDTLHASDAQMDMGGGVNTHGDVDARGGVDARGDVDARGASLRGTGFGPQSKTLGSVIRGIKSAVTHFANENNIPFAWQSRYHDHIVRNQNEMNRIAEYIENNPIRWEIDCFYR